MSAPVYVLPPLLTGPAQTAPASTDVVDLLRQLVALQQEQVTLLKAQSAAHDPLSRWRALLARWTGEFPGIGGACKQVLPAIERAYLGLVREVTDKLTEDAEVLTDEFVLAEFLDRYGTKLAQMGNIVNQLTPLADASSTENG